MLTPIELEPDAPTLDAEELPDAETELLADASSSSSTEACADSELSTDPALELLSALALENILRPKIPSEPSEFSDSALLEPSDSIWTFKSAETIMPVSASTLTSKSLVMTNSFSISVSEPDTI